MQITLLLMFLITAYAMKTLPGGLYNKIEDQTVGESIERFLNDNDLHNCYARRMGQRFLALKCWSDLEGLMDVKIETSPTKSYQVTYI